MSTTLLRGVKPSWPRRLRRMGLLDSENEDTTIFQNVGNYEYLPTDMAKCLYLQGQAVEEENFD